MNEFKEKSILDLQYNQKPNTYSHENDLTGDFKKHAARVLKKGTFRKGNFIYYLHGKNRFGFIEGLRPGSTSLFAYKICKDKFTTENWLNQMGVSTLKSKFFTDENIHDAILFVKNESEKTFVVKPKNLSSGRGIIFNVNYTSIESSLQKSSEIQKQNGIESPSYIIQEYVDGFDIRIYVAEGVFACALWRVPAHVVGNGVETIEELIEHKNKHRESSVYFSNFLYEKTEQMNSYLNDQGYKLTSVPTEGEIVFISYLGNLQAGAESVDVTHLVSQELKDLAVRTVSSVPGLHSAGVDILTEKFNSDTGYVIEVNTNANNKVHYLPYYGKVQTPYVNVVRNMLVKYKVEHGLILSEEERDIYKEIIRFNKYKDTYLSIAARILLFNE